jgi:toxin ParE1/3/4
MPFEVFLTADAARDLEELYQYIALHDAPDKAEHVLTSIEKAFGSLSESPDRGAHPKELLALGIRDYREIFFKTYRVIYRVLGNVVHVLRALKNTPTLSFPRRRESRRS